MHHFLTHLPALIQKYTHHEQTSPLRLSKLSLGIILHRLHNSREFWENSVSFWFPCIYAFSLAFHPLFLSIHFPKSFPSFLHLILFFKLSPSPTPPLFTFFEIFFCFHLHLLRPNFRWWHSSSLQFHFVSTPFPLPHSSTFISTILSTSLRFPKAFSLIYFPFLVCFICLPSFILFFLRPFFP